MFDDFTIWQALLSSEQNRKTQPSSEIFIFHVMFDDFTIWQALLSSGQNRSTEPW
jgi:hypothetical protein